MKKLTLSMAMLLLISTFATAATGWFSDFVKLKVNGGTEAYYWIGADPIFGTQLQSAALGSLTSLEITGCDMKYWSDTQDRLGGAFYYKVTNVAGTVNYIAATEIVWDQAALGGNDYQGTKATTIDLLASLPYGTGSYKLYVWAKSWGSNQGDDFLSNTGSNYVATFSATKANPTSFSGTYKVGDSSGSNFTSLSAAVSAINAGTISGNVVLEITSDITETVNIGLKQTSEYTLTIRPDQNLVTRTITFNHAADDNSGPSGAFCIGIGSSIAWADLTPTKNIIIDGFSAVSGDTRRLKIATATTHNRGNGPIVILDDCSNIQIKNCIIEHNGATVGTSTGIYAIYLRVNTSIATSTKKMPSNITIENNEITCNKQGNSQGIALFSGNPTTATAPSASATGIVIKNNSITVQHRGILLYYLNGLEFSGNEIRVNQVGLTGVLSGAIIGGGSGIDGSINIFNNKFIELKSANSSTGVFGIRAIIASGAATSTWYIYNNYFTGFDKTSATAGETMLQAIRCGSTCKIYQNTFYLNTLTKKPTYISTPTDANGSYCAINIAGGTPELKNNIFISNEDAVYNFAIRGTVSGVSDYNNMYLKAGNTNARINSTYATFATYRTANPTKDINSISKDVSFVSATDLSLTGTSINDVELGAPRLASVLTDNIGTSRGVTTYMGAHEVGAIVSAAVNASDITMLNNVAVTSTGHLTLDQDKTLVNVSLEAGAKVTLNDTKALTATNLTIKSTANNTGTFVNKNATGGVTISGTKSIQQYLASARNWYMSSPVSDAKVLAGYTYYQYNEPDGSLGTNWTSPTLASDLTIGRGYIIKPTGEDTYNFSTTAGTLNDGNYPVTLYRTDGVTKAGFNLLGNPYPSYLNVDDLVNADVESSYWVRTRNQAETGWAYDTYNIPSALSTGNSGKAVSKFISPMQAFWLRVKSSVTPASLTFTNAMRDHKDDVNNNFRAPAVKKQSVLRLLVSNGTNSDEALVYFNENASNALDAYDSPKMTNGLTSASPDLYTMIGTEQLAINGMNTLTQEIPLYFNANTSSTNQFSLSATEVSNFDLETLIYIKNIKTGDQQLISDGSIYNFDASTKPNLSIIFKAPSIISGLDNNDNASFYVFANNKGQITVTSPAENENNLVSVYNAAGQCVLTQSLRNTRTVLNNTFVSGVYVVKVNDISRKIIVK